MDNTAGAILLSLLPRAESRSDPAPAINISTTVH